MLRRRLLVLAAIALSALFAATAVGDSRVFFRTVAKGDGSSSELIKRTGFVVRSASRWADVWRQLNAGVTPPPRRPAVDFSQHMLLVVTLGQQTSGGHSIAVRSITDGGSRWTARVRESRPGPECLSTAVITAPFHVVRVRRSRDGVSFARTTVKTDC